MGTTNGAGGRGITASVIASVREHLAGARVVLSTWEGSDVQSLEPDELVTSPDPGAFPWYEPGPRSAHEQHLPRPLHNNVNRQIVSTLAGLRRVSTRYALKLRSDIALAHAGFLDYFERFDARHAQLRAVRSRLLTCEYFARNPRAYPLAALPFHPSDWAFFGYTSDAVDLWDIALVSEAEQRWFETRERPVARGLDGILPRYAPEQAIWLAFLRKHFDVPCEHMLDLDAHKLQLSEISIVNNLVILSQPQFGLVPLKVKLETQWRPWMVYSHAQWLELYRTYCDPRQPVPTLDVERFVRAARLVPRKLRLIVRRELARRAAVHGAGTL